MVFWRKLISKADYFIERRFSSREDCLFTIQRYDEDNEYEDPDISVKNISPYGLALESNNTFKEGEILKLTMKEQHFSENKKFANDIITVETIWASKRRHNSKYIAGVRMLDERDYIKNSWFMNLVSATGLIIDHKIHFRAWIRYPVSMNIHCEGLASNIEASGKIINIGAGGIAMETALKIPESTNLNLRLGPEFGLQQVSAVGEVRWVLPSPAGNKFIHGIAFQFPISNNKLLYKYVETVAITYREKRKSTF